MARPQSLQDHLDPIRRDILDFVHRSLEGVHELGETLLESQTGSIRPALLLVGIRLLGEPIRPGHQTLAEMVELIHLAATLHEKGAHLPVEDLVPGTPWNAKRAILLGDLFLARAMRLLAQEGNSATVARVAAITSGLAEGQILGLQFAEEQDFEADSFAYGQALERILKLRYGNFLGHSVGIGAETGGAHGGDLDFLASWGEALGMAYGYAKALEDAKARSAEADFLSHRLSDSLAQCEIQLGLIANRFPQGSTQEAQEWLAWISTQAEEERDS